MARGALSSHFIRYLPCEVRACLLVPKWSRCYRVILSIKSVVAGSDRKSVVGEDLVPPFLPSMPHAREDAERRLNADIQRAKAIYKSRLAKIIEYEASPDSTQKNERIERLRLVLEMRDARSCTFREIGDAIGVSSVRARDLYYQSKRVKGLKWVDIGIDELSVRARNGLHNHGLKSKSEVSALTHKQLLDIPNFGYRSLLEVIEWLGRDGLALADEPQKQNQS